MTKDGWTGDGCSETAGGRTGFPLDLSGEV